MAAVSSIYQITVRHVRREPVHNEFSYLSYQWFVDVDDLPVLPWWLAPFAQFRSKDHVGDAGLSITTNVRQYLADQGIESIGKITMLSNAAVLGYVFNPLSLFWCHHEDGSLACVIAEVHNTYGQRHLYLLGPEVSDTARVNKKFYVSPFYPVDGQYRMHLPEPGEKARLSIVLERERSKPFVASVLGNRLPATTRNIGRMLVDIPLAPLRVSVQIFYQGVKLWLRKLPVQTRPKTPPQSQYQPAQQRNNSVAHVEEVLK
ncbi:conserved hypothetical protein [Renibacterium salmoninarum ATCC 33209]|uniref:DUF1365 domain-containing protein n=1 Tax=Renibacterium salmoninarum (strain ATCC 33209 / DSM 20767 / JCM 11484 / NBRC 15589 / NCIMB 2235) TaxID=288705 RepID=A9WVG6_RENSM|nr:DUF1365 domain-containing protein [Renibacterium salmoninarum]ABY25187.1 conserved hypothetical protein [Renibacterium salmoninarum ATCC 33209]